MRRSSNIYRMRCAGGRANPGGLFAAHATVPPPESAGLAAPEPAPGFLAEILTLAAAALARRGYGEEEMLAPLWQRLEQRKNPAQRVRRVFAEMGLEGLIESSDLESYLREKEL